MSAAGAKGAKAPLAFRLARPREAGRVRAFVNENFDWKLPLVNRRELFAFYSRSGGGVQFALAEEGGELAAAAGYIRANRAGSAVWASVFVSKKGHNGAGLALMAALPDLTGAQLVACNNIRPETMPLYRFLGWQAGRVGHFYRLADLPEYRLARVRSKTILPAGGDLDLQPVASAEALAALGMPPSPHAPQKDVWYMQRRYFAYPHLRYQVYAACQGGRLLAYLACRVIDSGRGRMLRIADFVGDSALLPRLGGAIDRLLAQSEAEYAELYCAGVPAPVLAAAGFCERREGDMNILPNYVTPPVFENTDYYYFTSRPENFVLFKADGDQDRPNLPAE